MQVVDPHARRCNACSWNSYPDTKGPYACSVLCRAALFCFLKIRSRSKTSKKLSVDLKKAASVMGGEPRCPPALALHGMVCVEHPEPAAHLLCRRACDLYTVPLSKSASSGWPARENPASEVLFCQNPSLSSSLL